jgi:hypothetical protein
LALSFPPLKKTSALIIGPGVAGMADCAMAEVVKLRVEVNPM